MEGERIWLFVTRLFPKDARAAVNGAGRAGWKSLGAYVRVQILVAIDAIGIGIGAANSGCSLAIPLGVLVFLGSFVPVIGALISGVAVLLALVALGPVQALIMLGIVLLLVQQLGSHILQPLIYG